MAIGTKYVAFLIVFHTIFFFAGVNGYVDHATGAENPSKELVSTFRTNSSETVNRVNTEDSDLLSSIGVSVKSLPLIGPIIDFLAAPYSAVDGSGLPKMYRWLIQALFGFMDIVIPAAWFRGKDL